MTRASSPPIDHQRGGRKRRCRVPSAVSRMCSATEGGRGQHHPEDHRDHLQRGRAAAVAGVDGRREAQARRGRAGQIGEHADDLRPEVIAALLAAQRRAGMLGVGALRQPDEFGDDPVGVRSEGQALAGRAQHLAQRGSDHRDIAHDEHQLVVGALDEQPAIDGLGRLLGHRRQQHRLAGVLRSRQSGGRLARHADVQFGGHIADQRRLDAAERAVLRPVQLGGGLVDRQHRGGDRQHGAEQAGDDSDEAGQPVICSRAAHGGRC